MLKFPTIVPSSKIDGIVTWKDGTDAQIVKMVQMADAGLIDLSDYWSVEDERTVSLSAMAATGVGETHAAQDVTFVLMDTGAQSGYKDANDKAVNFVVGMKDCLNEAGYMNSANTNSGSWYSCARRTWCNWVFYEAIPSTLRPIFKQFKTVTASEYNSNTLKTSLDYFALFAEKEILGGNYFGNATEAAALSQIEYYKTEANRIKNVNGYAYYWWERSPFVSSSNKFCAIKADGTYHSATANGVSGIAPFGCI